MENNKIHILIVDDDNRIRDLLKEYLSDNNYIVSTSEIAKNAKVNRLIIGHYSKRYSDLDKLLIECKEKFDNTFLANEGDFLDFDNIEIKE